MSDDISANKEPLRERNWDAFAAVIAAMIGLLALLVSGYTAYLQRQQVRAQVWPHIEISTSNFRDLSLGVGNQGLGPAKITALRVRIDGKPVKHWYEVVRAYGQKGTEGFSFTTLNGTVVPADKAMPIFVPADTDESRIMFESFLNEDKHKFEIDLCYCSLLDECWYATDSAKPHQNQSTPIDQCPIVEADQFDN